MSLDHDTDTRRRYRSRGHLDHGGAAGEENESEKVGKKGPRARGKSGFSKRMEVFRRVAVMDIRKGEVNLENNEELGRRLLEEVTTKAQIRHCDSVDAQKAAGFAISETPGQSSRTTAVREYREISDYLEPQVPDGRSTVVRDPEIEAYRDEGGPRELARRGEEIVESGEDEYVEVSNEKENRRERGTETEFRNYESREEPGATARTKSTLTSKQHNIHGRATIQPVNPPRIPSSYRHAPPQQRAIGNHYPRSGLVKKHHAPAAASRPPRPPFRLSPTRDRDTINLTKSGLRTARHRQGIREDPFQDVWNADAMLEKTYRAMMDGNGCKNEKIWKKKKEEKSKEAVKKGFLGEEGKRLGRSSSCQIIATTAIQQKTPEHSDPFSKKPLPDPRPIVSEPTHGREVRSGAAGLVQKRTQTISVQTDIETARSMGVGNAKIDARPNKKIEENIGEDEKESEERDEEWEGDDVGETGEEEEEEEDDGGEEYNRKMARSILERELESFRDRLSFGLFERRKKQKEARRRSERIRERARTLLISPLVSDPIRLRSGFFPIQNGPHGDQEESVHEKQWKGEKDFGEREEMKIKDVDGTEEAIQEEEEEDLLESTDAIRTARPRSINEEAGPSLNRERKEEEMKQQVEVSSVQEQDDQKRRDFLLPDDTIERILWGRNQIRDCLRMKREGTVEPWKVIERIAEEFVQESIAECAREIGKAADDYVEKMIEAEMRPTSTLVA